MTDDGKPRPLDDFSNASLEEELASRDKELQATVLRIMKKEEAEYHIKVGAIVEHPVDGRVRILSGYYLDPIYAQLSNWWTWIPVDEEGSQTGEERRGYGWSRPSRDA